MPASPLSIEIQPALGSTTVARLSGEFDMSGVEIFDSLIIGDLLAVQSGNAVLDLAEVSFMDSTGLGALIRANQFATAQGIILTLLAPSARVRKLLEVTGVASTFTIVESPDQPEAPSSNQTEPGSPS